MLASKHMLPFILILVLWVVEMALTRGGRLESLQKIEKLKVCMAFIVIASIVLDLTGKCWFYHRMSFTKLREFSFKINGID